MFTGLIQDLGEVISITPNNEGAKLVIKTNKLINEIQIDDSVACNGVCLTATQVNSDSFVAQAVHVTLEKTTIGALKTGSKLNLELALRPIDRLGGHFVQGHVNGRGKLIAVNKKGENFELTFELPEHLMKYMISEGSIAIDGISLTIAKVQGNHVSVSIIPHTWSVTALHTKKVGDLFNIEADMLAKYLENFMNYKKENKSQMTFESLTEQGY